MTHSLGFVTRPFRTIGMRHWMQPRLNTALTHLHGQPLAVRPIENRDANLIAALLTRLSEQSCWLLYAVSCYRELQAHYVCR